MYRAPLREMRFVLEELLGAGSLSACPGFAEYSNELGRSVLEEAGRFAESVLDPLNRPGDVEGARWTPQGVVTAPGFRAAYQQFVAGGWPALGGPAEFGGQPVPRVLVNAVGEFWGSANLAFKLGPMLTHGAVHALELTGSAAQQRLFLPRMVSGEWSGTMVLTEAQAGSDLGAVRTRAVPDGNAYRLFGQKIFITWGDHDLTTNIVHMVLGRLEGAPAGVKGISLFIVPKVLVSAEGSLGARNDVRCLSIERKLGIHASPTCVLAFGEQAGAAAQLVGEPGRGLEYMFIMMNSARLSVGSEGYAVGERAFQRAAEWARTRVQGRPPGVPPGTAAPIVNHPDVRRMLLEMKAQTEASRALTLYTALQFDLATHSPDAKVRAASQARGELLTPIVKGWCTEIGNEVTAIGVQVHGGMGFIEETGAAQYVRDVRVTTIYEGTTGIQSNDLIGRKLARDRGAAMVTLLTDMERELRALPESDATVAAVRGAALEAVGLLARATRALLEALAGRPERAQAVSVPYLKLCGYVSGGWLMAKSAALAAARSAGGSEREFYAAKLRTAAFYAAQVLPAALALARVVEAGGTSVADTDASLI
ncbi:MAG TPA: acyl-CoA dehydrogenase [Steroidobacteraceae bacterium]|jgi:alkylation response protein AidB-like acyl-CoA dehydrogenase|nr:acyl-CoA dehydrogenase [Steroidobacteraceae bacterium]